MLSVHLTTPGIFEELLGGRLWNGIKIVNMEAESGIFTRID